MARVEPGIWVMGARAVVLDRPRVVAILNVTPDSFFDGGRLGTVESAVAAAARAVEAGADVLDVGGESTRPGAERVSVDEQIRRVVPVIEGIRRARIEAPISVDTTRAAVARAALGAGADAVNDVSAGTEDSGMFRVVAEHRGEEKGRCRKGGEGVALAGKPPVARGAGLVLMHRLVPPGGDSYSDRYGRGGEPVYEGGVVAVVREFLRERAMAAEAAGVAREGIAIDPGLGFGKTVEQNLELIRRTGELVSLGYPVMSGLSRKSFVGRWMGMAESTPEQRLEGTVKLTVEHVRAGAGVVRVHDVGVVAVAVRG